MKKIIFLFVLCLSFVSCYSKTEQTPKEKLLRDSINKLVSTRDSLLSVTLEQQTVNISLMDSIVVLNQRTVMTASDFIELYKFQWLLKYYRLCNLKPTNWKYYKGWSTRVFEAENKNYKPTDYVPDATKIPGFK